MLRLRGAVQSVSGLGSVAGAVTGLTRGYFIIPTTTEEATNQAQHANIVRLISAYRSCGHTAANLDPLGLTRTAASSIPELTPEMYGLDVNSSDPIPLAGLVYIPDGAGGFKDTAPVSEIVAHLQASYTGDIGAEFHVPNPEERAWFAAKIESLSGGVNPGALVEPEKRVQLAELLAASEEFDAFMQRKFAFVKRYGLEGAEGMLAALEGMFESASGSGVSDIVVAMPHRGRLNFMTTLLETDPVTIFGKLKGKSEIPDGTLGSGDVLSHLATSVDLPYSGGARTGADGARDLHVSLIHNPSHLEHANPVALGKTRSRQTDGLGDGSMCLMLHGDAAFAGQGIVQESFMLSQLPSFKTGGTVHLIVNNQLGFTAQSSDYRSSRYSSDVGKVVMAPVIHVNGENPEAVYQAGKIAVEFRAKFKRDVIVDMVAYRRRGHNELDEPAFTQPLMYKAIRSRKTLPTSYAAKVVEEGLVSADALKAKTSEFDNYLNDRLSYAESDNFVPDANHLRGKWSGMSQVTDSTGLPVTGVPADKLREIGKASVTVPDSITLHKRIDRLYCKPRVKKLATGEGLDWATAETLAWGTLLDQGYNVRISGQDVGRGTFSHRHVYLYDQDSTQRVIPLNALSDEQGSLEIANSSLSELGVLGFELGYAMDSPNTLNMWEAQFGDFANGAQAIIDVMYAASEQKYLRQHGLVLLLPHGMDGAGPEHSSARIERFLQLCDGDIKCSDTNPNMFVINPTTPANYFHALRRQLVREFRKPLVVFSPKTLLRLPEAVSSLDEFDEGTSFTPVFDDPVMTAGPSDKANVDRVLLCSGKVYYDLVKQRDALDMNENTAILRLEELHPFPLDTLADILASYSNAETYTWVQEEAANNGAWRYVDPRLRQIISSRKHLSYAGRPPLAAVAVAHAATHKAEIDTFMAKAFGK